MDYIYINMIPKTIHLTWKSKSLPPILKLLYDENLKFLRSKGYNVILWSDEEIVNLINKNYPNFYEIYSLARTGVQRGDISRLLVVYHYGGIYIDLDVLVLRDFADIIDMDSDDFYISYEPSGQTMALYNDDKYICNAFFAANKNNIVLNKLIKGIQDVILHHGVNVFCKFDIFGGNYIKKVIKNANNVHIIDDRELIFPINDLKLDNMPFTETDWNNVRNGEYPCNPIMIHYWIHGDFESKNIIASYKPDKTKNIHDNMYMFFEKLYPNIAVKYIK